VAFLTKIVQSPRRDDQENIKQGIRYLRGTKDLGLTLEVDYPEEIIAYIDASYVTLFITQLIATFLEGELSLADVFSLDSDTKGRVLSSGVACIVALQVPSAFSAIQVSHWPLGRASTLLGLCLGTNPASGVVCHTGKTLCVTHGETGTTCLHQVAVIDAFLTRRVGVAEYTTTPFACYRCAGHKNMVVQFSS
jgi:hypothetical protein